MDDYTSISEPENIVLNIEGKVQSLEQYLLPRLKVTQETICEDIDLLPIIGKAGRVYWKAVEGNVYFDKNISDDNIVGKFNGLIFESSCPRLIMPKKIADMYIIYSSYIPEFTPEEITAFQKKYKKSDAPSNSKDKINPLDFTQYITNARYRQEVHEPVNNTYLHFNNIELMKTFFSYLEKFRIQG